MLRNNKITERHLKSVKTIFASDLDQTIIFSKRFFENLTEDEKKLVVMVEDKSEDVRSFMSIKTIDFIKKFSENNFFIPATTRTVEQYQRVYIFNSEIFPKYAVVSNGGNILINGKIDLEWQNIVKTGIKKNSVSYSDVLKKFSEIASSDWVSNYKCADDLFYYFIIDRMKYPFEIMKNFEKWLFDNGWILSIQNQKMYFIPKIIDKFNAISYIAKKENINFIYAAGDSVLDLTMLLNANISFIPSHSAELQYLKERIELKNIIFTKKSGIFSSEEFF